ncbi:MAG: hypothetical protein L6R40_002074 [Gallowayella cf. fulva]|nr:MAG: hypothetical protein L6R40_002074 [Xanthomendoza cf. fulva]
MALSSPYEYKPLSSADSIRLLYLKPAISFDADLECQLIERAIHNGPAYEALSYVWGKDEFPKTLYLPDGAGSGGCLHITENLDAALRRLRLRDTTRLMWVDAVCIKQADDVEKAQQVARMASIYRNAVGVVAWLGESPEATAALDIGVVLSLSQKAEEMGLKSPEESNREIVRNYVYGDSDKVAWLLGFMREVENANVSSIYESAWFTRMWIMQEALLAKRLTLCHGVVAMGWDDFERLMMLIHAVNAAVKSPIPGQDTFIKHGWSLIEVLDHWRRRSEHPEAPASEMQYYMHQLRRRQCKDDRDRVFALLGLLPDHSLPGIRPDYSKNVVQVYTELTRSQLRLGNIGVLYDAGLWKRKSPYPAGKKASWPNEMPTWVADYRHETTFLELAETRFGTYFGSDPRVPLQLDLSKEPHCLATQATLIDIITSVQPSSFVHDRMLSANDVAMFFACRQYYQDLKITFNSRFDHKQYPTGEDPTTAFANAIAGGCTADDFENQDPLALWQNYEKCCLEASGEVHQAMQREAELLTGNRKTFKGVSQEFYSTASSEASAAWGYHHHLVAILRRHWFFVSDDGYAGLAPLGTQPETDVLAYIDGANVPFVLRDLGEESVGFGLVGPCYIQGLMDGGLVKGDRAFENGMVWIV